MSGMTLLALTYPWLSAVRSASPNPNPNPPRPHTLVRSHPPSPSPPSPSQPPSPSHSPDSHRRHLLHHQQRFVSGAHDAYLHEEPEPKRGTSSSHSNAAHPSASPGFGFSSGAEEPGVSPLEPPRPSLGAIVGLRRHSSLPSPSVRAVSAKGVRLALRGLQMGRRKHQPAYSDLRADENRDNKVPVYAEEAFSSGISFKAKYIGTSEIPRPSNRVEIIAAMRRIRVHHSTTIHSTVGAQYELKTKGMKKRPIRLLISNDCLEVYYKKTSKKFGIPFESAHVLIHRHPIYRVFYVSHDSQDALILSYVFRNGGSNTFCCSVFKAYTEDQAVRIVRTIGQAFDVGHPPDPPAQTAANPLAGNLSQDMPRREATAPPPTTGPHAPHTPSSSAFLSNGLGASSANAGAAAASQELLAPLAPLAPPPPSASSLHALPMPTPLAMSAPPAPAGVVHSRDSILTLMDATPDRDADARAEGALSDTTSKTDSRNSAHLNDLNLSPTAQAPHTQQPQTQSTHMQLQSDAATVEMSASGTSGFGSSSGSQHSELVASACSFSAGPLMAPAAPAGWQKFSPIRASHTTIGISTAGYGANGVSVSDGSGSDSKHSATGLDDVCMSPSLSVPRSLARAQAALDAAFGGLARQCCVTDSVSASASTSVTATNPFLDDSQSQSQAIGASRAGAGGAGPLCAQSFEAEFESMLEERPHSSSAHKRLNALAAGAPPDGLKGDKHDDREAALVHMAGRVCALEERLREQTDEMHALSSCVHSLCDQLQKQELSSAQEKATLKRKLEETHACVELVSLVLLERCFQSGLSQEMRERLVRNVATERSDDSHLPSPVNVLIQRRFLEIAQKEARTSGEK